MHACYLPLFIFIIRLTISRRFSSAYNQFRINHWIQPFSRLRLVLLRCHFLLTTFPRRTSGTNSPLPFSFTPSDYLFFWARQARAKTWFPILHVMSWQISRWIAIETETLECDANLDERIVVSPSARASGSKSKYCILEGLRV